MRTVVGIGCGSSPGPRFEDVEDYYIVDVRPELIEAAARRLPNATPFIASATDLPFPDRHLDAIVARNVFGDPYLAAHSEDYEKFRRSQLELAKKRQTDEFIETHRNTADASDKLKDDILREAGRVLIVGGQLIIVEDISPAVNERYLKNLDPAVASEAGLTIAKADIAQVTPSNYASAHSRAEVWTATRAA